jgi:DNA-binding MarR family transcriptional regulator
VTTSDRPLPDVWFTRDLPVLRAIARLVDEGQHGGSPYLLGAVVPASGLPKADVVQAAKALASMGYVEVLTNHAGEIVRCTGISPEARRLAGLWPTPQGEWDRLLEQVTARAEHAPTDIERQRWRALADAATAVGPDDGALLMSALIGGYVPRRR